MEDAAPSRTAYACCVPVAETDRDAAGVAHTAADRAAADRARATPTAALPAAIIDWFHNNARDLPWRRPGFSAWGTLVSEFMLQQTPVARVIPPLTEWLERWPTPADLAAVPPGEAVRAWASLGYPRRALWLHACAVAITEHHDGVVPSEVDALLALPGVGDYTARAVAVFAYGRRHPVVDTNVRRVIARAAEGQGEPAPPHARRDLAAMRALLPRDDADARAFNAGMMELGAIVCTARTPRCDVCPLRNACAWRAAGYPEYFGPRKAVQKRYEGSDRHVRGLIMRELRAAHRPVTDTEIASLWADATQRNRALDGLLADGLAVPAQGGYVLPG
ncbi:MAG: A/G-specific adenine glycosylase [Microbacteriaceae bacterium]|nr:MAG: A/G-specific adenine glycosylase [Microbacteriaceae bacterium]